MSKESKVALQFLLDMLIDDCEKKFINPLINSGELLRKDLVKSYFEANFDDIFKCATKLVPSTEHSLLIAKERIADIRFFEISELFNPRYFMQEVIQDEGLDKDTFWKSVTPIFRKFLYSTLWYVHPEFYVTVIATYDIKTIDELRQVIILEGK